MTNDEINEALRPIYKLLAGVDVPEPVGQRLVREDGVIYFDTDPPTEFEKSVGWKPIFTLDQLQSYAAAAALNARREVLEEAKGVCLHKQVNGNYSHDTRYECAAAIEQLKGKV